MSSSLRYHSVSSRARCFWCGQKLDDSTLEANTRLHTRRICSECQTIVEVIIQNMGPIYLGEMLIRAGERENTGRYLELSEVRDIARGIMEEAAEG